MLSVNLQTGLRQFHMWTVHSHHKDTSLSMGGISLITRLRRVPYNQGWNRRSPYRHAAHATRRPLWPVAVVMAPLVVDSAYSVATRSDAILQVLYAYFLLLGIGLIIYMVRATRQYGCWLRDNYADPTAPISVSISPVSILHTMPISTTCASIISSVSIASLSPTSVISLSNNWHKSVATAVTLLSATCLNSKWARMWLLG